MKAASRAKPASHDPVSISIVVRLLAAHNLLLGALRRGFGPELSLARFDLLATLAREDGQTLAALSRRMLVTAGNLTGLVDRAERDGIVERRPEPSDRRLTRVFLTARGHAVAERAIERHAEVAEAILGPLEPREREELRGLLGRLREVLDLAAARAAQSGAPLPPLDDEAALDEPPARRSRNGSGRRSAIVTKPRAPRDPASPAERQKETRR